MFVLVVVVLLVSVKMAPAWRSVTLSPFSTFTQGTVSHKAQGHTKHTVTCTCSHTKHSHIGNIQSAPHTKHTVTQAHITQGTVTQAHHHTRHSHTITQSTGSHKTHKLTNNTRQSDNV